MSDPSTSSPVCVLCKQSCEGRKYAKDKKGRIICRECIDKRKAQRAGSQGAKASEQGEQAALPSNAGLMASLLSSSKVAHSSPCPSCQNLIDNDAIICPRCGYNKETGKALNTRVIEAPKEKTKVANPLAGLSGFNPMHGVWAMGILLAVLGIASVLQPSLAVLFILVVSLYVFVAWIFLIIDAFRSGQSFWGIIMIIPVLNILTLYYVFAKCESPTIRAHYLLGWAFYILAMLNNASLNQSMDETGMRAPSPTARVALA